MSSKFVGRQTEQASDLINGAAQIPGFRADDTGLVVVSLSGIDKRADPSSIDLVWGPDEVLAAWV